jgi:hypothetical protein
VQTPRACHPKAASQTGSTSGCVDVDVDIVACVVDCLAGSALQPSVLRPGLLIGTIRAFRLQGIKVRLGLSQLCQQPRVLSGLRADLGALAHDDTVLTVWRVTLRTDVQHGAMAATVSAISVTAVVDGLEISI